jgi:hypothetical protein
MIGLGFSRFKRDSISHMRQVANFCVAESIFFAPISGNLVRQPRTTEANSLFNSGFDGTSADNPPRSGAVNLAIGKNGFPLAPAETPIARGVKWNESR